MTAAAGAAFHFLIAFVAAAVYAGAAHYVAALRRFWVVCGLAYGASVWAFMNFGVLPFSLVAPSEPSLPLLLNGVIGHAVFVGLPIAYFAHRPARR
jgi:hypothetical protein